MIGPRPRPGLRPGEPGYAPNPRRASAALLAAALLAGGAARADDAEAARAAYDRGNKALEARRYQEAATELGRADALAPNPVALAAALKVAALADDPALGMTLADRAEQRPGAGGEVIEAARKLREKFASRVGRLSVRCAAARACAATVDAEPFPVGQERWVAAGRHALEIDGGTARYPITVDVGKTLDWQEPAPAAAPAAPPLPVAPVVPAAPVKEGGVPPAVFWAGLGVTAILGGVAIWSGLDTLSKHDDFAQRRTDDPGPGKAAQLRTNVIFGVGGGVALATGVLGVLAFRSPRAPAPAVALDILPGPLGASLRARF